jgi:hypothetical protein
MKFHHEKANSRILPVLRPSLDIPQSQATPEKEPAFPARTAGVGFPVFVGQTRPNLAPFAGLAHPSVSK